MVVFDGRRKWERELSLGLRGIRELVPSPGLFSQRAVEFIKWTEDWVERVGEGGISWYSSSSPVVSKDHLPGFRIPGLRTVGSLGFQEWPDNVVGKVGEKDLL
jgi:hypothetical protein